MNSQYLIRVLIKKQNEKLLQDIASRYNLDETTIKNKYLAPTFYIVDIKK